VRAKVIALIRNIARKRWLALKPPLLDPAWVGGGVRSSKGQCCHVGLKFLARHGGMEAA